MEDRHGGKKMRRQIIILIVAMLCAAGVWANDDCGAGKCETNCDNCVGQECCELECCKCECECDLCCEPIVVECVGPPWSGAGCDSYTCGEQFILGYLDGGWSEGSLGLNIHSRGTVEVFFTWIPAWNSVHYQQLGTRSYQFDAGNYSVPFDDILSEIFGVHPINLGALWIEWRACGDSYIYVDGWAERKNLANDAGFKQRALFSNAELCPSLTACGLEGVCPSTYGIVKGCYEVPIASFTDFIRGQFVNTSETDWQAVYIDGVLVEVPPLIPELPEMTKYNFLPQGDFVDVCIGRENPWSGGLDYGDGCVLVNFEQIHTESRRRISLPVRPKILID